MNTSHLFRSALRLGLPVTLALCATLSHAQTYRRAGPAAQPPGPSMSARVATGAPSASGLASPSANPAGLPSQFPAGLGATPPSGDPVLVSPTSVMGAGPFGGTAGAMVVGGGFAGHSPLQIAQSFMGADGNRDGELSRGEAQRLLIAPYSFEEMDTNRDGILTRSEYEDALR